MMNELYGVGEAMATSGIHLAMTLVVVVEVMMVEVVAIMVAGVVAIVVGLMEKFYLVVLKLSPLWNFRNDIYLDEF